MNGQLVYLCHRYAAAGVGIEVDAGDARRWAEHFAGASYGDALLGAGLALLLRPDAPAAVQVWLTVCGCAVVESTRLAGRGTQDSTSACNTCRHHCITRPDRIDRLAKPL